ncbi:MAG: diguanylate cyclase [Zoogloeaceae bacterium]|jgi:CheY-like chemotaxis protein|nr:diguanylate cyclase [Zoogloeaceae bacterium]
MSSVLLVHHSKVVRVTLGRHLKDHYSILEAQDVETAWQLLVLHHDVSVVISGLDVSQPSDVGTTSTWISGMDVQLSGITLLDRIRQNNLQRLRHVPFYIIASESRIEEISEEARQHGVTGFIANGMSREEILAVLSQPIPEGEHSPAPVEEKPASKPVPHPEINGMRKTGLLSEHLFKEGVQRMFARPGTHGAVLLFCLEHYAKLKQSMGEKMVHGILEKFAGLVQSKVASGDFVGYYSASSFAIATHISDLDKCGAFARKVVKSLSAAKISTRGKPLTIAIQHSMVCCPADGDLEGAAILALLDSRLREKVPALATAPAQDAPVFPSPEQQRPPVKDVDFPDLDIGSSSPAPTETVKAQEDVSFDLQPEPLEAGQQEPPGALAEKQPQPVFVEETTVPSSAPRKIPTAPEVIPDWELL